MREVLLSKLEQLGDAELEALASIVTLLRSQAQTAVDTAARAEAKIDHALVKAPIYLPQNTEFQELTAPTYFGVNSPALGTPARGISFIFGQFGFLGYENNADGTSKVVDDNYSEIVGQELSEIELVNRRTLMSELSGIATRIQGSFLNKDGDSGNTGAEFEFSVLTIGESAQYGNTPSYATFTPNSFVNVGYITTNIIPMFANYLPLTGGTVDGNLTINHALSVLEPGSADHSVVVREQISGFLQTIPTVSRFRVQEAPVNSQDVVRLSDISGGTVVAPSKEHPVWVSGKICVTSDVDLCKAHSPYEVEVVDVGNQLRGGYLYKLLKYNGHASHDSTDNSFSVAFSDLQRSVIPGYSAPSSILPHPVSYTLYMEKFVEMRVGDDGGPVRIPLAQTDHFRYGAFLDMAGDLSLMISTDGYINVPWDSDPIYILDQPDVRFYLVVDRWSYFGGSFTYPNSGGSKAALYMPSEINFYGTPTLRTIPIYASDVDWGQNAGWAISINSGQSTAGVTVTVNGTDKLDVQFTGTGEHVVFTLTGTVHDLSGAARTIVSSPVTVNLKAVEDAPALSILDSGHTIVSYNGYPSGSAMPFSFKPVAQGGIPPYTWTITGSSHASAAFDPNTGRIVGTAEAGSNARTITLHAVDSNSVAVSSTVTIYNVIV